MERIICISDPHGCLEELKELIDKVKWNPKKDKLVILGDLVDRGPDSIGVVRFCRENDIACVLGNHEEKYLRYIAHNEKSKSGHINPMKVNESKKQIIDSLSKEDIAYLQSFPHILKLMDNWYAIHGGLNPKKAIDDQKGEDISYIRYVKEDGTPIKGASPVGANIHWSDKWLGQQNIVYGHFVHSKITPRIIQNANGGKCYGLDTGCCFGGYLTALILPSEEIVQVKAKAEYVKFKD